MADTDEPRPDQNDQPAEAEAAPETPPAATAPEVPDDLSSLPEEQLRELYASLRTQIEERAAEAKTMAEVEELARLRALAERIYGEVNRRREEEQAVAESLAQHADNPLAELPEPTKPEASSSEEDKTPELVNASAAQIASAREDGEGRDAPPNVPAERPTVVLLAAAGAENIATGEAIDYAALGNAWSRVWDKGGGDVILASLPAYGATPDLYPELLTTDNGPGHNTRLMEEAQEDWRILQRGETPARQGTICEPFDILRDIPDDFQTSEPVRGIFPSRPMGRMGWNFIPSIDLADVVGGVQMWFEANQAAVDPDTPATWKPCVEVTCPEVEEIVAEAVVACLTFDITTEMSQPERVRNFMNAIAALMARTKEGRILQRIDALSHSYQFFPDYGALPGVIEALNTVLAQLTFTNRTSKGRYVLIVPPGVEEVLTIDRANKGYNDEQTTSSDVMAYLRSNVAGIGSVVQSMDSSLGGEPGLPFAALTPITDPPTPVTVPYISGGTYRFRLVAPDDALYAETGQMNVGVTRDSQLIRQNRSQWFAEEFFALAKNGPSPWATVDITLCADGGRAGLYDPTACAAS